MRIFRFFFFLLLTIGLIYLLDNRWVIAGNGIPPLGKFLDPFHGFWQNMESAERRSDELRIPGLKEEVTVYYDSLLVPHIFAKNHDDLFLAQGFITATHRLWQMEFQTHAASGRVSEIIGDVALDYDRIQRRSGMVFGAENFVEGSKADKEVTTSLEKYTQGVNAYINSLSYRDLPFEYKLLGYEPEQWTFLKMGLLFMNFSQTLNRDEADLEMTNALKKFGKDTLELLYAENDHPSGDPIVDNSGGWNFTPVSLDSIPLALPDEYVNVKTNREKLKGVGSNNWAVNGSKTATGAPILSNDPHLSLSHPSVWYVVHLNAPGLNVMGGSLPGAPAVILGFNDSIAWGCTNAQRDLADWYKIRFRDASREEYISDGKYKKSSKRIEEFKIRDKESFFDTVVYTHHGPVVYDRNFKSENQRYDYAFRWVAHDRSAGLKAFYLLNHAINYDDYRDAIRHWVGPAQNFAFASVSNDIAITVQGKFPVRRRNEGKFLLDGTDTNTEWQHYIPFEQNITSKNPERGFVSSANQYPADETYPYYILADWYESFRNRRINNVLSKGSSLTPGDMMQLQNDNFNLKASEILPHMLALLDVSTLKGEESRVAEMLTFWDYINSRESVTASYFDAWWDSFMRMAWDEMVASDVPMVMPEDLNTMRLMKNHPDLPLWDIVNTKEKETLQDLMRLSFSEAVQGVSNWEATRMKSARWADFKDTYVQHLLRLEPLSSHPRVGGGEGIVNAADHRVAPSWRYIVSLEKPQVKAWGVYPAGQSGNPGSPFYDNMVDPWAEGSYYRLVFQPDAAGVKTKSMYSTVLKP